MTSELSSEKRWISSLLQIFNKRQQRKILNISSTSRYIMKRGLCYGLFCYITKRGLCYGLFCLEAGTKCYPLRRLFWQVIPKFYGDLKWGNILGMEILGWGSFYIRTDSQCAIKWQLLISVTLWNKIIGTLNK